MVLDPLQPQDNVLISELPKHIRETRAAILAQSENYITSIPVEFGTEAYDVMFLDSGTNMFRRSRAGDEQRNRVHGIYLADSGSVKIAGYIQNDAWSFTPGATIFVSANEYGDLTETNTGLVAGIAITNDTIIVASTISEQIDNIMLEIADGRLGYITLGQAMRALSESLVANVAEVVAARGASVDLNARILDVLNTTGQTATAISNKVSALELAISDAIRTYPSLQALMLAHETQFNATYNEVAAARGSELTLKARIDSIVGLYDEVIAARQGRLTLLENLLAIRGDHTNLLNEIVAARGAYSSLSGNIQSLTDTKAEVINARGAYSTLAANLSNMQENTTVLLAEIVAARGLATTLSSRLNVSINDDGTLKTTVTPTTWFTEQAAIAKVSATIFTVAGDKTAVYVPGRAVELNGNVYGFVITSAYSAGTSLTTVSITGAGIPSGLTNVAYSFHPNVLPQQSHANLANVLVADETSADTTKNKHVSNNQLKVLYDSRTSQGSSITTLQGQVSTLISDLDAAEALISNHAGRLTTAEGTITSQGTRLTTAEGEIDVLQAASTSQGTNITNLQNDVAARMVGKTTDASTKSAGFTAVAKGVYRLTAGNFTITLPGAPVAMDWFTVIPEVDLQVSPVTLGTSSQKFQGKSENLLIDVNQAMTFWYTGATYGWTIIN